jgi:Dolichyl-phosphate-mannose-protein mannosyltransferase/F5/8 type C domain
MTQPNEALGPERNRGAERPWLRYLLFAMVLALAVALRVYGFSWGLRHPIHRDEQDFVTRVVQMVRAGDLDHRWYQYPGLFLYILGAGVALLGPEHLSGSDPYWVSRLIVACFGVLNTGLIFVIGSRLVGLWGGFVAAVLLAAAPVDVHAFHQVRADVVLQTVALLALPALRRLGPDVRGDIRMGLVIGFATAVKFTGLLLVPAYLSARLLAGRGWLRGFVVAGLVTIAVTLACTPYALIHAHQYFATSEYNGVLGGPATYYSGESHFGRHVVYFLATEARGFGVVATLLFLLGLALSLKESWRTWLPPLLHPLTTLVVVSAAAIVFPRHLSASMGVAYLLAAVPLQRAFNWNAVVGVVLTILAVSPALQAASERVLAFARPSAEDKALDWINVHTPAGAHILETRPGTNIAGLPGAMIGLDPTIYAVVYLRPNEDRAGLALLAPRMDLVIAAPGPSPAWAAGLETAAEIRGPLGNSAIKLMVPAVPPAIAEIRVDLSQARLTASDNSNELPALRDGLSATSWSTSQPMHGREWLQVEFDALVRVSQVEVFLKQRPARHLPELQIETSEDGRDYHVVRTVEARPILADQIATGRAISQRLVFASDLVRGVRILQLGTRPDPWSVSELVVHRHRTVD